MHANTLTIVIISIKNNFVSICESCIAQQLFSNVKLCCCPVKLFLHFIYISVLFSIYWIYFIIFPFPMRKKTAKVILLFQQEKQVLLRGVEKKSGLQMALQSLPWEEIGKWVVKVNEFYISKHQAHLSFYLLYVWSIVILEVYMVESGLWVWCISYHKGMNFSITRSSKQWNDCVETKGSLYIHSKERKEPESTTRLSNTLTDARMS